MQNQPLFQGIKLPEGIYGRILRDISYLQINLPDIYNIVIRVIFPEYDDYLIYKDTHPKYSKPYHVPEPPALSVSYNLVTVQAKSKNFNRAIPEPPTIERS